MARVKFLEINPKNFLEEVQNKSGLSFQKLADICRVHRRSFSDWKYGECLMPLFVFEKLVKIRGLRAPKIKTLPEYWYTRKASRAGGLAVYKKYGKVPGWTREASRLGALRAAETLRRRGSSLFGFKPVPLPRYSPRLAEFVGIVLGDGSLTKSQVTISLHKFDDRDFVPYIKELFQELFKVNPSIYEREEKAVVNIVVSRANLVQFLVDMGLCIGDKVKYQVGVPSWIKRSEEFTKSCLRGLFDTDGCFYIDEHRYKDKVYRNCAMNFTNRSIPVLLFFKEKLDQFGFHPTRNTKFSVFLRRENEIKKYFQEVGCSNPKHLNKFKEFFEEKYGEVPKLAIPAQFRKPMVV